MKNTPRSPLITAVIPAFNEELRIGAVVRDALKHARTVIVVDDGSDDRTGRIALEAGAVVLTHPRNLGYGAALSTGFAYLKKGSSEVVVVLDGDGQHIPSQIPSLVQPILDGRADIVTGSRFIDDSSKKRIPAFRRLGIGIVNRAWGFASSSSLSDTQCGFRAYSKKAIDCINIKESGMSASLEILDQAKECNLRMIEVPVSVNYDGDTSTHGPGRHGMHLVNYVLRKIEYEHPLLILGGVGIVIALMGSISGMFAVGRFFDTGYLPFGPSIAAAVMLFVGVLLILIGLVLSSIQSLSRRLDEVDKKRE